MIRLEFSFNQIFKDNEKRAFYLENWENETISTNIDLV